MGESKAQRFSAFVSYSHADKKAAQKLHRRLEGYRLPKHVVETLSDKDEPAKLGQIFRDREDLPAAEDLSTSVKAALEVSQALIVLCSPNAKASPWVSREIELFRELHPDRPVLAALIDGEPEDAFPLPLTQGGEPLAADLRKTGDGPRLGFLKIVAGIAGVPLDALVQRDAQRRLRRVTMITGGALLAMLAMAIMTFVAIQSRNEAQVQRAEAQKQQAQADGLIGYMLGDLREDLKGVGRLDIMTAVNKRAMKYYESQKDLSALPAKSLEKRAFILHGWGEDDEKRGDLDKALIKFKEAHRVTKALLEREPDNPDRIFAHAQSEYWVGRVHHLNGDWDAANQYYEAYSKAGKRLNKMQPTDAKYFKEVAWGHLNLGILKVRMRSEEPYGAPEFLQAIAWMKKAAEALPGDAETIKEVGNAHAWLADSYLLAGNKEMSLESRESELEWRKAYLALDPKNIDAKYSVTKALYTVAYNQHLLGQKSRALKAITVSGRDMRNIAKNDPTNTKWSNTMKRIEQLKRSITNDN